MAKKKDLVAKVQEVLEAKDFKVNQKVSIEIVDEILGAIVELTKENGKLSLFGFGNFEIRDRAERVGRNPQDGSEILIPATKAFAFKAAKATKDKINN